MPKVSVIIPTYNRGYIVDQAIRSVLEQTLEDFELLIVDDGSTDDTGKIVSSITDSRIRYFYKQNGGVSSARNLGMANAQGLYISFLDSDDIWPKNFLEVMVEHLDKHSDFGAAYVSTVLEYPDGRRERSPHIDWCVSGQITVQLFKKSIIWPMAVLIRSSVLKDFWFDETLKICDDNDAFLRLSVRIKFLFVPDVQVLRRFSVDGHVAVSYVEGSYIRALSLERFYYRLGGDKLISLTVAKKKLGHVYRRAAERHRKKGYRIAAIALFKRAIKYKPADIRLYIGLMRSLLMPGDKDEYPDWRMPKALDLPHFALTWVKDHS